MIINARFLTQHVTGVQRYAIELSRELIKLKPDIKFVAPHNIIHQGIAKEFDVKIVGKKTGYYWEQIELPSYLKKTHKNPLLLNLANMAPINYKNKIVTICFAGNQTSFVIDQEYLFLWEQRRHKVRPQVGN